MAGSEIAATYDRCGAVRGGRAEPEIAIEEIDRLRAAIRVRVADGPPQRIGRTGAQHLPGEEVWLVGEHRSSGE